MTKRLTVMLLIDVPFRSAPESKPIAVKRGTKVRLLEELPKQQLQLAFAGMEAIVERVATDIDGIPATPVPLERTR